MDGPYFQIQEINFDYSQLISEDSHGQLKINVKEEDEA